MRAVVDTNVLLRSLIRPTGPAARIVNAFTAGKFEIATSEPLMEELAGVLARPGILAKYHLNPAATTTILELLRQQAVFVQVSGTTYGCRDPKDEMLIETAVVGSAGALVTNDKDLLEDEALRSRVALQGVEIMPLSVFLAKLEEQHAEKP